MDGEGKERSMRVGRLLSASLAYGRPAAMQALAYWSSPARSPLQVVCVPYIRLCMYIYTCTCRCGYLQFVGVRRHNVLVMFT